MAAFQVMAAWEAAYFLRIEKRKQFMNMRLLIGLAALSACLSGANTPAEGKIAEARNGIRKNPKTAESYNFLAVALNARARETGDLRYFDEAVETLEKSFAIEPDNFEGLKAKTGVLLGRHEYVAAQELASALNKRTPDDVLVYGLLTDASVALGDYKEAETAAQWMLDLRPGNVPGMIRGAQLRELFGDLEGALDYYNKCFRRLRPEETEEHAWILTQVARLMLAKGDTAGVERAASQALKMFPEYYLALRELANVRMAQQEYQDAAGLYQKQYAAARMPETLFYMAIAHKKAGEMDEAAALFGKFESEALKVADKALNVNYELVNYYSDYALRPSDALKIAKKEALVRHDARTLEALAWALYGTGQYADAKLAITQALAVGIKDAGMLYRAGEIFAKSGDDAKAAKYFKLSGSLRPAALAEMPRQQ
jgi:tetratricopeptide (TPR) repeat protein